MHEGLAVALPGRARAPPCPFGRAVGQVMDEGSAVQLACLAPMPSRAILPRPCPGPDLVVVAEGGVFADQSRKAPSHDYGQSAWVGPGHAEDMPSGSGRGASPARAAGAAATGVTNGRWSGAARPKAMTWPGWTTRSASPC